MNELRFVRREDLALVVANDAGEEFRLIVDDTVLSELRHLSKRERNSGRVKPREIQALIRAGKSRAQVAEETGLEEADVERFEEPVLAERRYILELAQEVPVRTEATEESDQKFGLVIAERLVALGVEISDWSSWKDEETGWMIALEFVAHDVAHRAIWSFAHRKRTLSPVNPEAVNLSKQGDIGDRLIPKLRAVDSEDKTGRFDSGAFDHSELLGKRTDAEADVTADPPVDLEPADEFAAQETVISSSTVSNAEYARRREIDQRAIKTDDSAEIDLSQTADLLDALRKRRGEREQNMQAPEPVSKEATVLDPQLQGASDSNVSVASSLPKSIWGASGVVAETTQTVSKSQPLTQDRAAPTVLSATTADGKPENEPTAAKSENEKSTRKGRTSIPSWDDILFGTRSDEDPA